MSVETGKKRKSSYTPQNFKRKKRGVLTVGMKGFLCSFSGNIKDCIKEAMNILSEYSSQENERIEKLDDNIEEDIEDALASEMSAIKRSSESGCCFQVAETGADWSIFIHTSKEDPSELGQKIFRDIKEKRVAKSRHLMKLLPVQVTCKAYIDDIKKAAEQLFRLYFKTDPTTYSIVVRRSNNNSILRDEVFHSLATLVKDCNLNHKVDLKNPKMTVVVNVIKAVCCLSVVPDFHALKKYNLIELAKSKVVNTDKKVEGNGDSNEVGHKEVEEDDDPSKVEHTEREGNGDSNKEEDK